MSTEATPFSYAPVALTGWERWLSRWWPSRRLGHDPLESLRVENRYVPVSIANWKLTPPMRRALLARRVERPLQFSHERLTVVIPYRDRAAHLGELLPSLIAMLKEQQIDHRVLVVEQEPGGMFNRARLINIGMHHAAGYSDYYCIHDADAIPVVANYLCPSQPLRLVHKIIGADGESHRDNHYFSGAVSIRREQAFAVNGFANGYWGWGKEDDDFFFRLLLGGYLPFLDTAGVFHDLPNPKHQQVQRQTGGKPAHLRRNRRLRSDLVRGAASFSDDGLSSLSYTVLERKSLASHDQILVRW